MSLSEHPAASLPEVERLEYMRLIASIALVDGQSDSVEVGKLHRLADALRLHPDVTKPLFDSLTQSRLDAAVSPREVVWFKEPKMLRWHLMLDSIAIAFSDGKLSETETRRIAELARLLEVPAEDVSRMASMIENILFKRDADHVVLARELGEAIGSADHGEHVVGRMRTITGRHKTI
jgi:uncharacterized tellurite resistance protein B-like protein